jgi:hypothetical protein
VNRAAREAGSGGFLVLSGPDGASHAVRQLHSSLTYAPLVAAADR